jgi:dienelactone hydrolase
MLTRRDWLAATAAAATLPPFLRADTPLTNVFKPGDAKTDLRLGAPKTLNDYFPFAVPASLDEWKARATALRTQLKVALGIFPEPAKTPLDAVIHGKIARGTYTIEKVYFRSTPGHTVCGNLYRPTKITGKVPGVLFAHGHWNDGRFHDAGEAGAKKMVERGEEPDVPRARLFMQALPVTLAKLGFVVFQFDMVGYADSTAIPHIARSGVPHPQGFADAEGELRLQSLLGLQTWNCIRSIDFLSSLPDVDASKLGMTGASGGGTQTFLTAALDERIAAAFPAVMVSTGMQGGCVCENCSLLRVNTGNVEIAGLIAPRPLAMSGANDWTKEIETKGLPELKKLYAMYGKEEWVAAKCWPQFPHNYSRPSREMMYGWFLKHLMGKDGGAKEGDFEPLPPKQLSVFDAAHPRPKDELPADKLRAAMTVSATETLAKLQSDPANLETVFRPAFRAMLVTDYPKSIEVRKAPVESKPDGATMHLAVLGRATEKDAVPVAGVFGPKFTGEKAVVWAHPGGKASLFSDGQFVPAARTLIDAGYAILAPDCFGTGEAVPPKPHVVNKTYAAFTYGYNRALLANRVHDLLTVVCFGKTMLKAKSLRLVGWGEAGTWAVLAKALAGDAVSKLAADLNQFRFEQVTDTADPHMLPGALKYGGLATALALCTPGAVLAHNHRGTGTDEFPKRTYDAAQAGEKLLREAEKRDDANVVAWLMA